MSADNESRRISRRLFVKGGALTGAGVAASGLFTALGAAAQTGTPTPEANGTATPEATPTATPAPREIRPVPEKWDLETEVLVIGYGGAGAAAAIAAHEAGAEVLIIEKQPEDGHTSNTQMCAGAFLAPDSVEEAIAFMEIGARVNPDDPNSKAIPDDVIQAWAEYMVQNREWLESIGAKGFVQFSAEGRDPTVEGNEAIKAYQIETEDGAGGVGVQLFELLAAHVEELGIEVLWETPGKALITNPRGEVVGAWAEGPDGEIAIRAAKAVILTTGGFEFDDEMLKAYMPIYPLTFYGNPDNTGDGVRMAQAVGADLWHMTVLGGGLKAKFEDFPTAFLMNFGLQPYMIVDKTGRRYINEARLGGYSGYWHTIFADTTGLPRFPRIPSFWIFDQNRMDAGPLAFTNFGAAGPIGMYEWSKDNSVELERGWILMGETVEELAEAMGVDPEVLQEEIDAYNAAAEAGEDEEFGRTPQTLMPLEGPPFYAVPLMPGLNNTFGGPKRNAQAQIVDVFGQPIPRLYAAGELGSIYVQYPQGGANVGECFAFGRIAGEQAAALEPWTEEEEAAVKS
ncbi:MAG: FAD-dependent oxidoreductase [Anaerolineae bacterium]